MSMREKLSNDFLAQYELLRELGKGAFGVVMEARQLSLDRRVAIKFLHGEKGSPILNERRFQREAKILTALAHANIVSVIDFGYDGSIPYIVTEFLEGESLEAVIERQRQLPWAEVVVIARQIAAALAAAHEQGVFHRDLKPANVFIVEGGQVKVLDFGLAKRPGVDATLTRSRQVVGTPMFAPPEQLRGKPLQASSDIYSLGVLLYWLLTGAMPYPRQFAQMVEVKFHGPKPNVARACSADVPQSLCRLIDSMLSPDMTKRPATGELVVKALDRMMAAPGPTCGAELVEDQEERSVPSARGRLPLPRWIFAIGAVLALRGLAALWLQATAPAPTLVGLTVRSQGPRARVIWSTSEPVATRLQYRRDGASWREMTGPAGTRKRHEVGLTGLEVNRRYLLRPQLGAGRYGDERSFETTAQFSLSPLELTVVRATSSTVSFRASKAATGTIVVTTAHERRRLHERALELASGDHDLTLAGLPAETACRAQLTLRTASGGEASQEAVFTTTSVLNRVIWSPILSEAERSSVDFAKLWSARLRPYAARRPSAGRVVFSLGSYGLHCFDLLSERCSWTVGSEKTVRAIAVVGPLVYTIDKEHRLRCRRIRDGAVQWTVAAGAAGSSRYLHAGDFGVAYWQLKKGPVILDGANGRRLYTIWADGNSSRYWSISNGLTWVYHRDGQLRAFSLGDGEPKPALDIAGKTVSARPVVADGAVYWGRRSGHVVGRALDGRPLFGHRLTGRVIRVVVGGGRVFVATMRPAAVVALDGKTGALLWHEPHERRIVSALITHQGNLYFEDAGDAICARSVTTGQLLFRKAVKCLTGFGLVPSNRGFVYCNLRGDICSLED